MNCVVTAGPTYERVDEVRRLTNFSTGKLGTELANFLSARGHRVALLLGEQATHRGPHRVAAVHEFSTTDDLRARLESLRGSHIDAVFHAAAVSDFTIGKLWRRLSDGSMEELRAGKVSSRVEGLLVELIPTPKLIRQLREWFPKAVLVGWKYEVDGGRADVLEKAERQLAECRLNACVANGPAYGPGFGLVTGPGAERSLPDSAQLFEALAGLLSQLEAANAS